MMGITTLLLMLTGFQGLTQIQLFQLSHPSLGLMTTLIFAFTETFTITFISALVKSVTPIVSKDTSKNLSDIRSLVYKQGMLSLLWITVVFLLGGAVDTNLLPPFLHGMIFLLGFVHYFYVLKLQHQSFGYCLNSTGESIISEE